MKKICNLINTISSLIHHPSFISLFKSNPSDFTRNREWSFPRLFTYILKQSNVTMKSTIDQFFNTILDNQKMPTKSSLCQARDKLLPDAFLALNSFVSKYFFDSIYPFQHPEDFTLFAIDGTTATLPETIELQDYFGTQSNQFTKVAKARVSGCLETKSELLIDVILDDYSRDERDYVINHLQAILTIGFNPKKSIIVFDRGYPSNKLIDLLTENNFNYLFRVTTNFIKEVNEANKNDQMVTYTHKNKTYSVRVICLKLENGKTIKYITNLLDISYFKFKELYFKRWKVETAFDAIKNSIKIDNFTGIKPIIIHQDYYASICMYNLMRIVEYELNRELEIEMKKKRVKHQYEMNLHYIIIKFKDLIIKLLLKKSKQLTTRRINKATEKALSDSEARQIKKGYRSSVNGGSRSKKSRMTGQAYFMNKKAVF